MHHSFSPCFSRIAMLVAFFSLAAGAMRAALAESSVHDVSTVVEVPNEIEAEPIKLPYLIPQEHLDAEALSKKIALGSAFGAAAGATNHLESLRQRAWLPNALPMIYDYPDDVYYTVTESNNASRQASLWGLPTKMLVELNSGISEESVLKPGTKLRVLSKTSSAPVPLSSGPTNRGRLYNGWLMPEGDANSGYFLRTERSRSWATENTIKSLIAGFSAYASTYPNAPRINVGDFSKRRGGKISPHSSHTSGRDVDIGFVHTVLPDEHHPEHFTRATSYNVDAEKTWFVLKSIIQTGEVKSIYIDASVQKQLYKVAQKELNDQQLKAIFSLPRHTKSAHSIMQHWPGHKNHAHIRFICPENQPRCRK